jgi:hypothetical protein
MTGIASGRTAEADSWELTVSSRPATGDLVTLVNVRLADGSAVWGGGCGGGVPPAERLRTYAGAGDTGPRTFLARVATEVRAVVVTLSDGSRQDLVLHAVPDELRLRVGVLVYPRALDIHRVDLVGHDGEALSPDA